jgi:HK97 family phage major capsid protein
MPVTLKELKENRGKIVTQLNALGAKIAAENRSMSAEERASFEAMKADLSKVGQQINDQEEIGDLARSVPADPGKGDVDHRPGAGGKNGKKKRQKLTAHEEAAAMTAWGRSQYGMQLKRGDREAMRKARVRGQQKFFHLDIERRDMSVGTATAGGHTVPAGFSGVLEEALKTFGGPRGVADSFVTSSGNDINYPTNNDTGNDGEQVGENTAVAAQDLAFGNLTFKAFKFSSKMILVSYELLSDSAFNLAAFVAKKSGERIGRIQASRFTTGNGTTQPQGFLTAAPLGSAAVGTTALTVADLTKFYYSIDLAYRNSPSFAFMAHSAIIANLSLINDTTGRPLLIPSTRDGGELLFLGKRWVANDYMPATLATTVKAVAARRLVEVRDPRRRPGARPPARRAVRREGSNGVRVVLPQ